MAGVITKRIRQISMNDSENVAKIVHEVSGIVYNSSKITLTLAILSNNDDLVIEMTLCCHGYVDFVSIHRLCITQAMTIQHLRAIPD